MRLKPDFLDKIRPYNGKVVRLGILQIDAKNHPLGPLGAIMMGPEQQRLATNAVRHYKGQGSVIDIEAYMEIIPSTGHLSFINNQFDCSHISVFRPQPPMIVSGIDMSLWWSFHPLSQHEINKLEVLRGKFAPSTSQADGDSFPIREVWVNGVSHCS